MDDFLGVWLDCVDLKELMRWNFIQLFMILEDKDVDILFFLWRNDFNLKFILWYEIISCLWYIV